MPWCTKALPILPPNLGYCKLHKEGTDWIFTGRAYEVASQGAMLLGGLGGLEGIAAVAGNTTDTYEMKLDGASGRFIKVREVKGSR